MTTFDGGTAAATSTGGARQHKRWQRRDPHADQDAVYGAFAAPDSDGSGAAAQFAAAGKIAALLSGDAVSRDVSAFRLSAGTPSIIPSPGSPPAVTPRGTPIETNGNGYTIASGVRLYATTIETILSGYNDLVTNHGTVWLENTLGHAWLVAGGQSQIVNDGLIYIHGDSQAELAPTVTRLTNSGSIFVVSNSGWAHGIRADAYPISVDNSGLIAVQSLGVDADFSFIWNATAIEVRGTDDGVVNRKGGRILAEAPNLAIGIEYDGGDFLTTPVITNAGRIQANATGADGTSIGIFVANTGYSPKQIVNSGTIEADFAIYAVAVEDTVTNPIELIENRASGKIVGIVSLGIGDDRFLNDGTVTGNVYLGAGADTFLGSGSVSGVVDLGFDNDIYTGSGGADRATGGRGDDTLSGGGGNDLLLGGFGNDMLEGGAGNDGLIGEWGNDTITTSGGDWVEGGLGNDRVALGDLSFRFASGGPGIDTLVLPGAGLIFDISAALATGRLLGFDVVSLQGSQSAVVRAGDVSGLSQGSTLRFDGVTGGGVALVGSWAEQATTHIGATTYRVFRLGNELVDVEQGLTVTISNSAPGNATGLDPIAGGAAAPRPGAASGLDYTPAATFLSGFVLSTDFTVAAAETFYSDGASVFTGTAHVTLTNEGTIYSLDDAFPSARGIDFEGPAAVINHGTIYIEEVAEQGSVFYYPSFAVQAGGSVQNDGTIAVYSVPGSAIGVMARAVEGDALRNSGTISAISEHSRAIGVNGVYASNILTGAQSFFNTGTIYAEAGGVGSQTYIEGDRFVPAAYAATGAALFGSVTNAGDIIAVAGSGATEALTTVGVYVLYPYGPATRYGVTNSGRIEGTIAIEFAAPSDGGTYANYVVNTGLIQGDIRFGNGNDDYDGRGGAINGAVYGFGGNDTLLGGADGDLFYGGNGKDTLAGGAGDDILTGGNGADALDGGRGVDTASYADQTGAVRITLLDDGARAVAHGAGAEGDVLISIENLTGGNGADRLTGNNLANLLSGGAGADVLSGGGGKDLLIGGGDRDTMTGGAGADIFRFSRGDTGDSRATADRITDFSHADHDRIDLSTIDAIEGTAPADRFSFIGNARFSGAAGELRYTFSGADTLVMADTDGDKTADLVIRLTGNIALAASDFVLRSPNAFVPGNDAQPAHDAPFHVMAEAGLHPLPSLCLV